MLITLVLVMKLGTNDITPSSLDFCELFAGGAEASSALRRVPLTHIVFFEFHVVLYSIFRLVILGMYIPKKNKPQGKIHWDKL